MASLLIVLPPIPLAAACWLARRTAPKAHAGISLGLKLRRDSSCTEAKELGSTVPGSAALANASKTPSEKVSRVCACTRDSSETVPWAASICGTSSPSSSAMTVGVSTLILLGSATATSVT